MKYGNWIPVSKEVVQYLPKDRPYTKLEAIISMQYDFDCGKSITVSGYSVLWSWSRNRVAKFLKDSGAEIIYEEDTKKTRNQKGHIAIHKEDIKRANKGHIRLINSKQLSSDKDIKRTDKDHKKDIKRYTTNKPKPNPDPKPNNSCSFFDPKKFKEEQLKAGKNPAAIDLAIKQAETNARTNKLGYAEKVLTIQNGNFNEKATIVHDMTFSPDIINKVQEKVKTKVNNIKFKRFGKYSKDRPVVKNSMDDLRRQVELEIMKGN